MNKKTKIIASSALTIAMCASVVTGATFALFTSESEVNISVSSGKVNIVATVDNDSFKTYSVVPDASGTEVDENGGKYSYDEQVPGTFVNGGTAVIVNDNVLTVDKMTPGDKVTFDIVVTNNSNVAIQYQTKLQVTEGYDLFSGLKMTLVNTATQETQVYDGMTAISNWKTLSEAREAERTTVTIELPVTAGNEYQEKSCHIAFTVNAVQGNAQTVNPEDNTTCLYNASDLMAFAKSVNVGRNTYEGKTVKLMNDIDLAGYEWTPVGQTSGYTARTYFQGTFDGNGKTISNLTIPSTTWEAGADNGANFATGFFGFVDVGNTTIKNVTFDNAKVEGHHWVGVVAGYMTGTVSGVTVTNSTITSTYKNGEADGDKAGGVVGYLNSGSVTGCTVTGSTITAIRDCGSVVGHSNGTVSGNTAENCTVYYSTDNNAQIGGEIAGKRASGVSGNTATNVVVMKLVSVSTADELSTALNATYSADTIIKLANDIDLSGISEWGAHVLVVENGVSVTIDGNNKTISNLTTSATINATGFLSNGLISSVKEQGSLIVKNMTVSNATVTNNVGWNSTAGVFVGDVQSSHLSFENCKVENANVTSAAYAAGFVGYSTTHYASNPIKFTNCEVTGSTFSGNDATGALVALNNRTTNINGATVTGNTINGGAGYSAGALVGTSIGGTTATSVTVSGNTFAISGTNYQVNDATYGYIYHHDLTYSVNGADLAQ